MAPALPLWNREVSGNADNAREIFAVQVSMRLWGGREAAFVNLPSNTPVERVIRRAQTQVLLANGKGLAVRCGARVLRAGKTLGEIWLSGYGNVIGAASPGQGQCLALESGVWQLGGIGETERIVQGQEVSWDELDEDDREVVNDFFNELDLNGSGGISADELDRALERFSMPHEKDLADALREMMHKTKSAGADVSFEEFYAAVKELPRVRGQRVQWVRTLGLERELARHLKRGDFFDGVKGLREMTDGEILQACTDFGARLYGLLKPKLEEFKQQEYVDAEQYKNTMFAMDGTQFEGSFAGLEDFYEGPEKFIGTPNPNAEEGLKREHCDRSNANHTYRSPNYNFEFTPALEFEFVINPQQNFAYAHTLEDKKMWPLDKINVWKGKQGRKVLNLDDFMRHKLVQRVMLRRPEVASLRMYTGPAYILYNAVMRKHPKDVFESLKGNQYETTIFCIMSGVTKLSKVANIPASRRVFRGLGGMILRIPSRGVLEVQERRLSWRY